MMAKIINTALAWISLLITVKSLENSAISVFLPTFYLYALMVLPLVFLALNKNPFNFSLFAVLVILLSTKCLPTPSFLGLLNVLHYIGYGNLAEFIKSIFSGQGDGNVLPLVVTMFAISQVVWVLDEKAQELRKRGVDFDVIPSVITAFAVGLIAYMCYSTLLLTFSADKLILGLMGICLLILAVILAR